MPTLTQEIKKMKRIADGKLKAPEFVKDYAAREVYGQNPEQWKGKEYITVSGRDLEEEAWRQAKKTLIKPSFWLYAIRYYAKHYYIIALKKLGKKPKNNPQDNKTKRQFHAKIGA